MGKINNNITYCIELSVNSKFISSQNNKNKIEII